MANSKGVLMVGGPAVGQMVRVNQNAYDYHVALQPAGPDGAPESVIYRISPFPLMVEDAEPLYVATVNGSNKNAFVELAHQYGMLARGDAKTGRLMYPPEGDPNLRLILGHMCFQLAGYCTLYRMAGIEINHKAEDEQAFMLDRMLRAYMAHGSKWIEAINAERALLSRQIDSKKENKQ